MKAFKEHRLIKIGTRYQVQGLRLNFGFSFKKGSWRRLWLVVRQNWYALDENGRAFAPNSKNTYYGKYANALRKMRAFEKGERVVR